MSDFIKIGVKKDFPENAAVGVKAGVREICIVHLNGQFHALENSCTHAYAQLSSGDVEDGEIVCPLHGARFSVATGTALTLPATKAVQKHDVKIEGENVFVKLSS